MSHKLCKQNIHRLMALLLALMLVVSNVPAASAAEGSCGDNLQWSLTGGTLTISGYGEMYDYEGGGVAPWYDLRDQITRLSLSGNLTHIGTMAFADCENLTSVSIPGSVRSIGAFAFSNCSGMTMVSFPEGLRTISDNAFERCASLQDLRVPATVTSIGNHAFYFCTNLTSVYIPSSMISFGSGIFSYCHALVHAEFGVSESALPAWTFYGCDQLSTVLTKEGSISASTKKVANSSGGTAEAPVIDAPLPELEDLEIDFAGLQENTTVSTQTTTTPSGETITSSTVVESSENATTVNKTTTTQTGETITVQKEITSTVVTPEGWNDVLQEVESAHVGQQSNGSESDSVTVYYAEGDIVPKDVLQGFVGKNLTLTIQTQSGTIFKLDCTQLPEKVKKDLDLSYTLVPAEAVPEGMEGCTVYNLTFQNSSDLKVEMVMPLPGDHGYQTATLYQLKKKEPQQLQSVMVDTDGNAHWYLRSIDHKTEYLIGINIPGAVEDSPIIPAELAGIQKVANVYDGVEYVVTGRTSSWNMGLGKVMAILAVVMVSTVVVVGFVLYFMNKQRLKSGYVPEWEDDDE